MPRDFKGRLTISVVVALGITIALLVALFLISRDIQTQATNIKSAKSDLKTRTQQLDDLARLREEARQAEPDLAKLETTIPNRDSLFSLRRELEQVAGSNNLTVSFAFGGENAQENNLGSINFEVRLGGGDFNIRSFINEIELNYPFVKITTLDMVRQENNFNATVKGQILFKE